MNLRLVALVLLTAACGAPAGSAPTAPPTQQSPSVTVGLPSPVGAPSAIPSPSPSPATAAALDLPVLGGTRAAWVRAKGNPTRAALGEVFDQTAAVTFAPLPDGTERATRIDLMLGHASGIGDRGGVPVAQARELARPFHPPDGRPIRTETAADNQRVEVFQSVLLAGAFKDASNRPSGDDAPGTYIQIADRGRPTTERVILAVGARP